MTAAALWALGNLAALCAWGIYINRRITRLEALREHDELDR